jgi:Fur family zinc uptake transcriptional regulator
MPPLQKYLWMPRSESWPLQNQSQRRNPTPAPTQSITCTMPPISCAQSSMPVTNAVCGSPRSAHACWVSLQPQASRSRPTTCWSWCVKAMVPNGFIHKLESVNSFVACHHPNTDQHSVPFLICDRCHSAVELEDREVVDALDTRARALGFVPQAQTLEVHGLCAKCAGSPA